MPTNATNPLDPSQQLDPTQQVTQTVETPNLEMFNPKPNAWSIIGDVLGRRRGLISSLAGGFLSDYGQRQAAKKEVPAFMKLLADEGAPLSKEKVSQINQLDPQNALQELSILQAQALRAKAQAKVFEPKQFWDPHAADGKGSIVWKKPGEDLTGLQTLGEHARQTALTTGQPSPYKDIRGAVLAHGGTPDQAAHEYFNLLNSNAVSKFITEKNETPLNDQASKWYNGKLNTPPPDMTRSEAFAAGYRPITSPAQIDNLGRLSSAYTDLTSPDIQRDINKVLRPGPLATEMKAIGATAMRDPSIIGIRNFNTNLLQLVNPTFSKTLRVNTQELEMLKSYFIKLPEGVRSPGADTVGQARAKVRNATKLIDRILRRNGIDPNNFKSTDEPTPLDSLPNDKADKLRQRIHEALTSP